jgi:acetyl esterase
LVRDRVFGNAYIEGIEALSRSAKRLPVAKLSRHGVRMIPNVPYGGGARPEHRCDVYSPVSRTGLRPVVLYVHGGAFHYLSKDTHWVLALMFARRGYVVFNIDYRLAPVYKYPAAIEDTCLALRWVHEHAREYGGDPERIVIAGESAGGNLATSAALTTAIRRDEPWARAVFDSDVRVRACVPGCAVLQVSDQARFWRKRPLPPWVVAQLEELEQGYLPRHLRAGGTTLADPLLLLEGRPQLDRPLPPFFAIGGTRDPILDDTRRLGPALDGLGVENEIDIYEGEIHAFHALVYRPNAREAWKRTYRFLERHIGSVEPSTSAA